MASRSFTIDSGPINRSFTVTQDGESRSFEVATGVGPAGPAGADGADGADGAPGGLREVKSASFTAANDTAYTATATLTVTDPTPSQGKGFSVLVRNGTATVGGTAYATAGTIIERIYHSGAWSNNVYRSAGNILSADISDASDQGLATDNGKIVKYGSGGLISTSGIDASIITFGQDAQIGTVGSNAYITTQGTNARIETSGENAYIGTSGANAQIQTTGANAIISTAGENAWIGTSGTSAFIQTRSTFRLSDGTNITTIAHSVSGSYTLTFTPTANATLTIGASTTLSGGTHSGTNTGDETVSTIASKLNAGTEDTAAADSDRIAVTSPAGGWMSLTTLWTWITGKLSAAFYRPLIVKKSTAQMDVTSSTAYVDITGMTGYSLEADSVYRVEFMGQVTAGASGGYKVQINSTSAFAHTTSGSVGLGLMFLTGGTNAAVFQLDSTNIQIASRTGASTAGATSSILFIKTNTAPTVKFQFAQNVSNATTSSLLSGAVASITKLI